LENVKIRVHSEDTGVDGKIILKCISENVVGRCGEDVPG
jgi:hypothetical protein